MAIPQENLPAVITAQQVEFMLRDIDTTGMSETDKLNLASILWEDYQKSIRATNYKPQRIRIVKEMQKWVDSLGNMADKLTGVVVTRQTTRWLADKANKKKPQCSSLDGLYGIWRNPDGTTTKKLCKICEFGGDDAWGTATDEHGNRLAGKACREMRRAYIQKPGDMFPNFISVPPTSLNEWDNFFSGRLNAGISDLKAQVELTLSASNRGGFDVSIVNCENGPILKPKEILEFLQIKKDFEGILLSAEVEAEDYEAASMEDLPSEDNPMAEPVTEVYKGGKGKAADLPEEPAF